MTTDQRQDDEHLRRSLELEPTEQVTAFRQAVEEVRRFHQVTRAPTIPYCPMQFWYWRN